MNPLLSPRPLMFLFGGILLAIIIVTMGLYFLQKSLGRRLKAEEPRTEAVRAANEAAFTLTAVKAVITQLKAEQTAMQERLIVAERRAEENVRRFELVAREIEHGLIIFDAQGFISFSNPMARKLLAVDTWSRRRYSEIFAEIPDLSGLIGNGFETGTEVQKQLIEFQTPDGSRRQVSVSVLPTRDRTGAMESVACAIRQGN